MYNNENKNVGVQNFKSLQYKKNSYQKTIPNFIGSIIHAYKAAVKLWCKKNGYRNFKWPRNFYDNIIRNKYDLNQTRQYVINNPLKWDLDRENPKNWDDLK